MVIDQVADRGATRIWLLQYGPCWCHTTATDTSSFDYVRLRKKAADLGSMEKNLLIVSDRVIDGSGKSYRQVYADVPEPKLVVSAATCPHARRFWDELPNGWTPVDELLPIDLHVDECINGYPEALAAAVLAHVLGDTDKPAVERVDREMSSVADERRAVDA